VPGIHPILGERIARQGLCGPGAPDSAAAATRAGGLQAQDAAASRLGVRVRTAAVTDADVRTAIDHRSLARTWLMRNTVHLVAAQDVRWLTALLGPMIRRRFETVRWPALGLTPDLLDRVAAVTPDVLHGRQLDRREFAAALAEHGVPVPADGQAPTHVLVHLSTIGLVCRAHDRGRDSTFALLDEWVPDNRDAGPRGDDALAELARRYFAAFSPATPADFTAWSGLPSSRAIALLREELTPVEVGGSAGYRLGEAEPQRGVRLLPAFDNYLLGYRDRSAMIDADRVPEVYVGGVIRPTLLVDGRVAGRWRLVRNRQGATVELTPFGPLTRKVRCAVDAEVADIARFVELPTTLSLTGAG
jgi:hypothetical protein